MAEDSESDVSQISSETTAFKLDDRIPGLIARVFQLRDSGTDYRMEGLLTQVLRLTVATPPTHNQINIFVEAAQRLISSENTEITVESALEFLNQFGATINYVSSQADRDGGQFVSGSPISGSISNSDKTIQSEQDEADIGEEWEKYQENQMAFEANDDEGDTLSQPESFTSSCISSSDSDDTIHSAQDYAENGVESMEYEDMQTEMDADDGERDALAELIKNYLGEKQSVSGLRNSSTDGSDAGETNKSEQEATETGAEWEELVGVQIAIVLSELKENNHGAARSVPGFVSIGTDETNQSGRGDARTGEALPGIETALIADTTPSSIEPKSSVTISSKLKEAAQIEGLLSVSELAEPTVTQEDVSLPEISALSDNVEEVTAEKQDELRRSSRIKAMKRKHDETL